MDNKTRKSLAPAAILLVLILAAPAAAADAEPLAVTAGEPAGTLAPGGEIQLPLRLAAADHFYFYRDRLAVTAAGDSDLAVAGLVLPPGRVKLDPNFDEVAVYEGETEVRVRLALPADFAGAAARLALAVEYSGCSDTICLLPVTISVERTLPVDRTATPALPATPAAPAAPPPATPTPAAPAETTGLLLHILAAFGAGLLIGLSPCVYPMIPITAAIIAGRERPGLPRGLLLSGFFVLGLALAYGTLGLIAGWAGDYSGLDLKHPALAVVSAAVFVFLAGSMFDLYNLQFLTGLSARLGRARGRGLLGVFVMGALSALVATPCITAPVLALLHLAASRGPLAGFLVMFTLALGFGTILGLAGLFTSVMPRPGEWMNRVKQAFGFILLGAAVYFLADLLPAGLMPAGLGLVIIVGLAVIGGYDSLPREAAGAARVFKGLALVATVAGVFLLYRGAQEGGLLPDSGRPAAARPAIARTTEDELLATMAEAGPTMLIEFRSRICPSCDKLEEETLADRAVRRELERFRAFAVNASRAPALRRRFGVLGTPTLVFVGPGGEELRRVEGFVDAETFVEILREID